MAKKTISLARVAMERLNTEAFALVLTNADKKVFRTAIGSEGLSTLLRELLRCAALWATKPALAIETLVGPTHALPAQKISFEMGRNPAECAVRMYLGDKMEMTFLLPTDALKPALAELMLSLESPHGSETQH